MSIFTIVYRHIVTYNKLLLALAFTFYSQSNFAQIDPDKVFTTHDGLPQIQVTQIELDNRGICWINTKGGLAQFDGEFITEQKSNEGESFSRGSLILKANNSIIFNSGKHLINYDGSTFDTLYTDISASFNKRVVFHKGLIHLIAFNKNKLLRISLDGVIIDSLDLKNQQYRMAKDRGIIYLKNFNRESKIYSVSLLKDNVITKVYETTNILHFNYFTNELSFIEFPKTKNAQWSYSILNHKNDFKKALKISNKKIKKLKIEHLGPLPHDFWWVHNKSLFRISDEGYKEYSISNSTHVNVLTDRDGNVIVSNEHGISVFINHHFTTYPLDFTSDIWTMHKQNNKFYSAHYSAGLYQFDLESQTKKYIPFNKEEFRMYYGSSSNDEIIFFPGAKGFSILNNGKRKDYLDINKIDFLLTSYYDLTDKMFYAGSLNSLLVYNPKSEKYRTISDTSKTSLGYIVELKHKSDYETWCGYWRGLKMYDKKENRFVDMNHLFPSDVKPSASSIAYDHKERLWVGGNKGLYFMDSQSDTLEVYSQIFNDKQILDIEFIPSRKLLAVGTNSEIYFIDIDTEKDKTIIKEFNYKNGFLGEEVAQNGFYLEGNELWIPSATHLSKIDISNISLETQYSNVFITSINNQSLSFNQTKKEHINIEKGRNNFYIKYGSVGIGLPLKRMYQYKLEGYDTKWSSWSNDEKVNYQNLGSGDYTFLLRGQKSNGIDITETSANIRIDLPLHKEPNFYKFALLALLLFFIVILLYFYFYRILSIKNKEKELSIDYLKLKGLQSQMNPHFIFNVLGSIQSLMLGGKIKEADKYLIAFSKLIRRFLDSSLQADYNGVNIKSGIKETSLADEIELLEIYTRFEEIQLDNRFSTEIEISPNLNLEVETIPPMIIQPFVENAIKHGLSNLDGKGKLNIRISLLDNVITCMVEDNGIGREKAEAIKKKNKFYHKSLGNDLVSERIDILNKIGYQISSKIIDKKKGTKVILKFSKNFQNEYSYN